MSLSSIKKVNHLLTLGFLFVLALAFPNQVCAQSHAFSGMTLTETRRVNSLSPNLSNTPPKYGDDVDILEAFGTQFAAVSAPSADTSSGVATGFVEFFVYNVSTASWMTYGFVTPPTSGPFAANGGSESFGASVSLVAFGPGNPGSSPSIGLVIGAPTALVRDLSGNMVRSGAVYFYKVSLSTTQIDLVSKTTLQTPESGDEYGRVVRAVGTEVFIGAPYANVVGAYNAGKTSVYDWNLLAPPASQGPSLRQVLSPVNAGGGENSGASIACNGYDLVVGAPRAASGGFVTIYTRSGQGWVIQSTLAPATSTSANDNFGCSIAMSLELLVIGANGRDTPTDADVGSIFVYRDVAGWTLDNEYISPATQFTTQPVSYGFFGTNIDLDGDVLVVSAPYADHGGSHNDTGAVYVYHCQNDIEHMTTLMDSGTTTSTPNVCIGTGGLGIAGSSVLCGSTVSSIGSAPLGTGLVDEWTIPLPHKITGVTSVPAEVGVTTTAALQLIDGAPSSFSMVSASVSYSVGVKSAPVGWVVAYAQVSGSNIAVVFQPTAAGSFEIVIEVDDGWAYTVEETLYISVIPEIALPAQSGKLDTAVENRPYASQLVVTGGRAPYSWNVSGLPNGLVFDVDPNQSDVLRLSGTTAELGVHTVLVQAADNLGGTDTLAYDLEVREPVHFPSSPLVLPSGMEGHPYGITLSSPNGGSGNFDWTTNSGALLPPGTSLTNNGTGSADIQGTPTLSGTYQFEVIVSDLSTGDSTSVIAEIIIVDSLELLIDPNLDMWKHNHGAITLAVEGGLVSHQVTCAQKLPNGVELRETNGNIWQLVGTPTESGAFFLDIVVTDQAGFSVLKRVVLIVHESDTEDSVGCVASTVGQNQFIVLLVLGIALLLQLAARSFLRTRPE